MLNAQTVWILRFVTAVALGLALADCNSTPRRAKPERTRDAVFAMLDEVQRGGATAASTGTLGSVLQMRARAKLYFADAPGRLGPARSLLSFRDYSFVGDDVALDAKSVSGARVFFFDDARPDRVHDFGLVLGVSTGQDFAYYAFKGEGKIEGGKLVASLERGDHAITLTSRDARNGTLGGVIQLQVAYRGTTVGKIPTLVAY